MATYTRAIKARGRRGGRGPDSAAAALDAPELCAAAAAAALLSTDHHCPHPRPPPRPHASGPGRRQAEAVAGAGGPRHWRQILAPARGLHDSRPAAGHPCRRGVCMCVVWCGGPSLSAAAAPAAAGPGCACLPVGPPFRTHSGLHPMHRPPYLPSLFPPPPPPPPPTHTHTRRPATVSSTTSSPTSTATPTTPLRPAACMCPETCPRGDPHSPCFRAGGSGAAAASGKLWTEE